MKYLTVKQLIDKLQKEDPKAIVASTTDNFEQGNQTVPSTGFYKFKGDFKRQTFRDAFDGGSYEKEVIVHDDKGKKNFIKF